VQSISVAWSSSESTTTTTTNGRCSQTASDNGFVGTPSSRQTVDTAESIAAKELANPFQVSPPAMMVGGVDLLTMMKEEEEETVEDVAPGEKRREKRIMTWSA
jgi:hypothetical protein